MKLQIFHNIRMTKKQNTTVIHAQMKMVESCIKPKQTTSNMSKPYENGS